MVGLCQYLIWPGSDPVLKIIQPDSACTVPEKSDSISLHVHEEIRLSRWGASEEANRRADKCRYGSVELRVVGIGMRVEGRSNG